MRGIARDLRNAVRVLIKAPGVTIGVLASLALGLGACTTIFSWINGILLQPFPTVAGSGEYVVVASRSQSGSLEPLSYRAYLDIREAVTTFDKLVAVGVTLNALNIGSGRPGDQPDRVFANFVSGNYFDTLSIETELGRAFRAEEDRAAGRDPVVVISHGLWQRHFGGAADVVGRTIELNGHPCTVIGVAEREFIGTLIGLSVDLWIPIAMQPTLSGGVHTLEDRAARWILGLGRVNADVERAEVDARLHAVSHRLASAYPTTDNRQAVIIPIWRSPWGAQGGTGPVLLMMAGVVGFLLLLSCANAANLLLARAVERRREIALRVAVGARRSQVLSQLLVESLVLALVAGVLGIGFAHVASDAVLAFLPPTDSPFVFGRGVDSTVMAFAVGLAVSVVMVFGFAPALKASRPDLLAVLREEQGATPLDGSRLRSGLVVVQVALCMLLLTGAGLFLRSLQQTRHVSPGFNSNGVLLATYDLSQLGYNPERGGQLHQRLRDQLAAIPGATSVSFASRVPLGFAPLPSVTIAIDTYRPAADEDMTVSTNAVGPDYFRTLQIRVQQGREFSNDIDTREAEPVAIVNETMAKRYWNGGDVIGAYVRSGDRPLRVVGVVADSKYRSLTEAPMAHLYVPISQDYQPRVTVHLRTEANATVVLPLVRAEVQRLDATLVLSNIQSLTTHLGFATLVPRLSASLLGAFGAFAVLIAALGIYSVVAFVVAARRRELGVRLAVGASPGSIRILVVQYGVKLAACGIVVGTLLAIVVGRSIANLLVGVSPADPVAIGSVALLLVGVTLFACLMPAIRASRLDVMRNLRP